MQFSVGREGVYQNKKKRVWGCKPSHRKLTAEWKQKWFNGGLCVLTPQLCWISNWQSSSLSGSSWVPRSFHSTVTYFRSLVSDSIEQAGSSPAHTSTHTKQIYIFTNRRNYSLLPNYFQIGAFCELLFISIHLCLQRFTGFLVWIKSQRAMMHSWECVSCFIWEDIGESVKDSEFWNKVPLVHGSRFLCKKKHIARTTNLFSVWLFLYYSKWVTSNWKSHKCICWTFSSTHSFVPFATKLYGR